MVWLLKSLVKLLKRPLLIPNCGREHNRVKLLVGLHPLQIHPLILTGYPLSSLHSSLKRCPQDQFRLQRKLSSGKIKVRLRKGMLLVIGNPLLDISACVDDKLLKKYNLKPNNAIVATEKHIKLFNELEKNYDPDYRAGGSEQNSVRVVQWILKKPQVCTFFGCVGDDERGKILIERASAEGVTIRFQIKKGAPTGTCAVLLTKSMRSLVAFPGAAQMFTPEFLAKKHCKESIAAAEYFYTSGFFLAVSPASIMQLAKHAHCNGHRFIFNISATFVAESFLQPLKELIAYVDILFGNETEAAACAKAFKINKTDIAEIALKISQLPQGRKSAAPRIVVITQCTDPVILVENGQVKLIPVPKLDKKDIVDTNGAGDAFTGGFLSQLVLGKSYKTCIECGFYAAHYNITHAGSSFNSKSNFKASD